MGGEWEKERARGLRHWLRRHQDSTLGFIIYWSLTSVAVKTTRPSTDRSLETDRQAMKEESERKKRCNLQMSGDQINGRRCNHGMKKSHNRLNIMRRWTVGESLHSERRKGEKVETKNIWLADCCCLIRLDLDWM